MIVLSATRSTSLAVALLVLAAIPSLAATCTAPTVPDPAKRPVRPTPPVKSACVDNASGPGCKGWEAYQFNDEVKAYNAKAPAFQKAANDYVAQLNAYVKAANDYAKCEVDALR